MFNKNLFNSAYHKIDISNFKFLITGGAGFIGSNIVEYLLRYGAGQVRVIDNLSNGYIENIQHFLDLPNFEFIEGDITDIKTCKNAIDDIDFVSHQAALGSVPRSISDPLTTNKVNVEGFLNILISANESKCLKNFVYAASSSTYGDSSEIPKKEGNEGNPVSPYAVTKYVNEMYADVFSRVYGFKSIGLRYFNVFGPKQNPNNPYAAVIPIFSKNFLNNTQPTIFGDGHTTRDFTFIENVVQANIKSLLINIDNKNSFNKINSHEIFNVACGNQISLNEIILNLNDITNKNLKVNFQKERLGDIKHSRADISKIKNSIGYAPSVYFKDGLRLYFSWLKDNNINF